MKKYFIIVLVTYDHYRFQRNLTVVRDKLLCYNFKDIVPKYANTEIYDYKENEEPKHLKENETEHLWIQEL